MMRTLIAGVLALVAATNVDAQSERHELGRRLVAFEKQWETTTDDAARKRALAILPKVTTQFFALQLGEAGRTLDDARWALLGETPSDETRWAESLHIVPPAVLHDLAKDDFIVTVKHFYPPNVPRPKGMIVTLKFDDVAEPVPLDKLPAKVKLLTKGDQTVRTGGLQLKALLQTKAAVLARIETLMSRDEVGPIDAWKKKAAADFGVPSFESLSLKDKVALLERLAGGEIPESDLEILDRYLELQTLVAALEAKKTYYDDFHPGDHTMSVPLPNKQSAVIRAFVPSGLDAAKPVPIVFALHGAGGSENMFFESYGAGHIVKECEKRGWMLVATRGGFLGSPPVPEILEALKTRYPIDGKKVFVVGHSMGAGQAAEIAQRNPKLFRGIALLGGAARVRDVKAFAQLPLFLGVGTKDQLAYKGSTALVKNLRAAEAANLTAKEYPEIEHLVIVREALPDVFAIWDKSIQP